MSGQPGDAAVKSPNSADPGGSPNVRMVLRNSVEDLDAADNGDMYRADLLPNMRAVNSNQVFVFLRASPTWTAFPQDHTPIARGVVPIGPAIKSGAFSRSGHEPRNAKVFVLEIGSDRHAIHKELMGLPKLRRGQAALEVIAKQDEKWRRYRRFLSTTVTKRKSTPEFIVLLVLRGDMVNESDVEFSSAPAAFS